MKNEYYKKLLHAHIDSAEFDEKIEKHCMSAEETRKTVDEDDRHDSIGRFRISKANVKKTLHGIVDTSRFIANFCEECSALSEGDFTSKSVNLPLKVVAGDCFSESGTTECTNLFLKLYYYKSPHGKDRMRVVTFYPTPKPVRIHR